MRARMRNRGRGTKQKKVRPSRADCRRGSKLPADVETGETLIRTVSNIKMIKRWRARGLAQFYSRRVGGGGEEGERGGGRGMDWGVSITDTACAVLSPSSTASPITLQFSARWNSHSVWTGDCRRCAFVWIRYFQSFPATRIRYIYVIFLRLLPYFSGFLSALASPVLL